MKRTIYWRVTPDRETERREGRHYGHFTDLKTLKGATARLERRYPFWREIEVQFDRAVGS